MIRKARLEDAADLTRLSGVLGYPASEETLKAGLARLLSDSQHILLVEEEDGVAIGMVEAENYEAVYSKGPMLNVLGLVVNEDKQGRGVGGKLMAALEAEGRARGAYAIRLNSGVKRTSAHAFYEAHGYVCSHEQKRFMKEL